MDHVAAEKKLVANDHTIHGYIDGHPESTAMGKDIERESNAIVELFPFLLKAILKTANCCALDVSADQPPKLAMLFVKLDERMSLSSLHPKL